MGIGPASWRTGVRVGALALVACAGPTLAQGGEAPAPAVIDGREVYTPADFAQYSPKTALDMLEQVPSFSVREQRQARGLGQASGNVLINGERLSSKSDSASDRLARIPADNVIRIEIVDAATLDVPGLTGRVANIVTRATGGVSGQFEWNPQLAAANSATRIVSGKVSLAGTSGPLDWAVAFDESPFFGGSIGPNLITYGDGRIEHRQSATRSFNHHPRLSTQATIDGPGSSAGHVNVSYQWDRTRDREDEYVVAPANLPSAFERIRTRDRGHQFELGGDFEFALGPGRLKLIGLANHGTSAFATQSVTDPDTGAPSFGTRFTLGARTDERIVRGEYRWGLWGGDWQLSAEAAFNRLDQVAGLFDLPPAGTFEEVPFPAGTGGVKEDRYESILSFGHPLTGTLTLQIAAGAEHSTISQTGANALSRTFQRPKGLLSLAWGPQPGLDVSFSVERKVGQLNFADFLADVNLKDSVANAGNNQLRPQQSWEFDFEVSRDLAAWGSAKLHFFDNYISDYETVIPLPGGVESPGNIARAHTYGVGLEGTLRLDPLGLRGAKVDVNTRFARSRLRDPLTGAPHAFDRSQPHDVELSLRHDVPETFWAWGTSFRQQNFTPYYRLAEEGLDYALKSNLRLFVENKKVLGLTVQARVSNLLGSKTVLDRTVYAGPRDTAPVLFHEFRSREIGRVVNFTAKGSF